MEKDTSSIEVRISKKSSYPNALKEKSSLKET